jgi:hypothetical protein
MANTTVLVDEAVLGVASRLCTVAPAMKLRRLAVRVVLDATLRWVTLRGVRPALAAAVDAR